jgi:uncharacterized protein (TIGR00730 family)
MQGAGGALLVLELQTARRIVAMPPLERIAVYCGSSPGRTPVYADAAWRFGETLVRRGVGLVYGGARVGLMGTLADAVVARGGAATGVIPSSLVDREIAHAGIADLRIVESMHERKALMTELADAFVALPGGMGTLDELAEAITWGQLGIHSKPCGVLEVDGYFSSFLAFLDHAMAEGFLRPGDREGLVVDSDPDALLDRLAASEPRATKWTLGEQPLP